MEMKVPTINHVRKAIKIAEHGGKKYSGIKGKVGYDQGAWCGTSCCVWGHALILAGNKQAGRPYTFKTIDDALEAKHDFMGKSDRHMALVHMMGAEDKGVLKVMGRLVGKGNVKSILKKAARLKTGEVREAAQSALGNMAGE